MSSSLTAPALALCLLPFGALAQPAPAPPPASGTAPPDNSQPSAPTPPAATPPATPPTPAPAQQAAPGTPATVIDNEEVASILGRNVRSPDGDDMGRIVDIIVSPTGQVRAAVIDFGGFLGVGSRKVAVSWSALIFGTGANRDRIIAALSRNQLRVSPEYKAGEPIVVLGATDSQAAQAGAPSAATAGQPTAARPPAASPEAAGQTPAAAGQTPAAPAAPAPAAPAPAPQTRP